MYVQTNHIPVVPVQPRAQCPDTHERPADNKPWNLFMPLITLDPERNGPHVATICKQRRVDKLQVTAKQFWNLLCEWITMNRKDFERYEAGDHTHRIRAKLLVVPVEDCMLEWARPYVWDLRAYARDPAAEIHPMQQHDERRSEMNEAGIRQLQRVSDCVDADIVDMMATTIETHAHPPKAIMLCPSSKSFFKNAKNARMKAQKEEEES